MQRLQNEVSFRAAELSVAVVKPHADDDVSVRFSLRPLRILAVPLALKSFLVHARKNADSIIKSVIPSGAAFQARRGISGESGYFRARSVLCGGEAALTYSAR